MKFIRTFVKDSKILIKIELDNGSPIWATTTSAVINYAKSNFKEGEVVKFEMVEKNGQYHITKILKADGTSSTTPAPVETVKTSNTEYKCIDCGKKLKDGKYKKCFECNKKKPAPKKEYSGGQRDTVGQSIEKQAMMKASAMAVGNAFVGQINDPDTLADMIIKVYEKLLKRLIA